MLRLAEEGYDVWLGNSRGTEFSQTHSYLNPEKDGKFWEFTWADMGKYDVPAMISKIKTQTG